MIKKICDRCGAEAPYYFYPNMCSIRPKYIIVKGINLTMSQEIHLCEKCEKAFDEWLHQKGE